MSTDRDEERMVAALDAVLHALRVAGSMTWQVTWSLVLGFTLSAVIEALVRKSTIARLTPNHRPRSLATASVLDAASLVLLLRCCRSRSISVSKESGLHRCNGIPDRIDQPWSSSWDWSWRC
jgi:hypothetical protein